MSSVNKIEIEKFSNMADEWWDPHGKFKPLHKFNPIRIKYIKENIIDQFKARNKVNGKLPHPSNSALTYPVPVNIEIILKITNLKLNSFDLIIIK